MGKRAIALVAFAGVPLGIILILDEWGWLLGLAWVACALSFMGGYEAAAQRALDRLRKYSESSEDR